jgi:hypothetical protein
MTKKVCRKFTLLIDSPIGEPKRIKTFQETTKNFRNGWLNRRDLHNYMSGLIDGLNEAQKEFVYLYDDFQPGDEKLPVSFI